ncbi:hypothetical protein [Komagataeibacter xylinus]|uniref:hypothetical protein n=1 Tax=Komagataeibacter xylinus TaxID=28448 RepID=UPI00132FCE2F|nr:hypothetical protein [Komagataeibacter xylinus]
MSGTDPATHAFEDLYAEMTVLRRSVDELPRVYRRVKLSEDEPYGREEENIALFA